MKRLIFMALVADTGDAAGGAELRIQGFADSFVTFLTEVAAGLTFNSTLGLN